MDKWQAQQEFWSSFGLPAYDEQVSFTEDDQPAFPHITYQSFGGNLGQIATLSASLWYKGKKQAQIKQKASEIERYIEEMLPIPTDDGYLKINTPNGTSFAQPAASGDDNIQRMVLTVEAESLSKY